jgi:hypothetical protein
MNTIPQLSGTGEQQQQQINYFYAEGYTTVALAEPIVAAIPKRKRKKSDLLKQQSSNQLVDLATRDKA